MSAQGRPKPRHWVVVFSNGTQVRMERRQAAMNSVDRGRGRVFGLVRIYHQRTGEEWIRRAGSWLKSDGIAAEVMHARRAAEGARHQNEPMPEPVSAPWTPWWVDAP